MNKGIITIIYDNQLYVKSLKSGWGFSCIVEYSGKKILFDTGDNPEKLLFNLANLKISAKEIDIVVLSHNHWDHIGGLKGVLNINNRIKVFCGQSLPENFKEDLKQKDIECVLVKDISLINKEIFVGPEMKGISGPNEVPLTIQTGNGLVIITGCAHPGIVNMVREVKRSLNKDIYLVLGGFHLGFSLGLGKIISEFRKIGVKKVGPTHCTGSRAIKIFEEEFKEDFIRLGAGSKITLDD